jgi:two-component system cell cycle response regulator CtrA
MRVLLVQGCSAETYLEATDLESTSHVVDVASGADEAFECLGLYDYDVVVVDGVASDTDGCGLIRRMRSRGIATPLLMLVAFGSGGITVAALRAGADDVVTRPIGNDELLARIDAILRRSHGHSQSVLRLGSLSVDMNCHDVFVGAQPMPLTRKEFGILQLLALRSGTVVTTQKIMNSLYDGLDDPQSRTIEVFICTLRKKLARLGADVAVDTVRGVGYILRAVAPVAATLGREPVKLHGVRAPAPQAANQEFVPALAA